MPSERTILLTGASGFIGGRLAGRLLGDGHRLRCVVRETSDTTHLEALAQTTDGSGLEFVRGDLTDPATLTRAVEGCGLVIHCAAMVSDWGTVKEIRAINTTAAVALGIAAAAADVPRFLHISTTDVYGNPGTTGVSEEYVPSSFANWYSETKREAEAGLRAVSAQTGMELVMLRPASVYGPGSADVVGEFALALRSGILPLIRRGQANAGLVYVDNVCDAVTLVMDSKATAGEVYNVTDELDITWQRFFSDLADGMGVKPPRLRLAAPLASGLGVVLEVGYRGVRKATGLHAAPLLSRQAVQVLAKSQSFSSAKLRTQLGWTPRVDYAEGMPATLTWLTEEFLPAH